MLIALSNQMADLVAAAAPSVVQVHGRRQPASGLVYAGGVVLTMLRVLGREDEILVRRHDGASFEAELAGWDPATGLAVLRVPSLEAPALAPAAADARVGSLVLAVARSWSNAVTASAGVVAVIGGPLPTGRRRRIERVIRTTAPMHEGFAGGALLQVDGGLLGVATAATIRGFGVVIPADIAWRTAAGLLEHGGRPRGYLGIAGQPVRLPDHQQAPDGRERALVVVGVTPGGPAAAAGVLVGDVLLGVAGEAVESPDDLLNLLLGRTVGEVLPIQVLRGGSSLALTVTLGERPER